MKSKELYTHWLSPIISGMPKANSIWSVYMQGIICYYLVLQSKIYLPLYVVVLFIQYNNINIKSIVSLLQWHNLQALSTSPGLPFPLPPHIFRHVDWCLLLWTSLLLLIRHTWTLCTTNVTLLYFVIILN